MERKHPLAECEKCPLAAAPCAPTIGPAGAKLAVVSRSPGYHEAMAGKPFSGPSGKVLDHLLELNGLKREDVLLTNTVLCHVDKPPQEAIDACALRLETEINAAETVIAAGPEAAYAVTMSNPPGDEVTGVIGYRGIPHYRLNESNRKQRVIITYNPAAVLHSDKTFPDIAADFKLAINPPPVGVLPEVEWTNDVREGKRWIERIRDSGHSLFSCDIESYGLSHDADLAAFGIAARGTRAISFGERVVSDRVWLADYLRPFLTQSNYSYLWHNGKFDVRNLRYHGINARVDHDTLLLSKQLDERPGIHELEALLHEKLSWPRYEPSEVLAFKKKMRQFDKDDVPMEQRREYPVPDTMYPYNAMDCAGAFQLYEVFMPLVEAEPPLLRAYNDLKIPGSNLLVDLELNGIPYDVDRACDLLEDEVRPYLADRRDRVQKVVGIPDFNPNSHQQTAKLWYDDWGITHAMQERTKPGTRELMERSVDDSARTEIIEGRFRHGHGERDTIQRSASLIDDFKKMDKQRGTYIEGLVPKAERYGRIHCDFNFGPITGRLSSTNPNLQNITRTKEGLPNIRALFVASPGKRILQVDYSQAELRTIACLSGDIELTRVYSEGLDLHAIAAARFYGPNFSKEERSKAKNMNFGMFYRQSAATFQEKHGIPEREAAKYIAWSKEEFKRVWDWEREIEQTIKRDGFVESPFGDRRRFHLLTRENAQATYREAINFLPQNTASNFTLRAAIELYPELDPLRYVMMILVHDSIVGECDEDYVEESATIIKQVMEEQPRKCVGWELPFTADVSVGPDWGHLEDMELAA